MPRSRNQVNESLVTAITRVVIGVEDQLCFDATSPKPKWDRDDDRRFIRRLLRNEQRCYQSASVEFDESATIITTDPNDYVAKIHDRTPIWLTEDKWEAWLNTPTMDLLRQPSDDDLEAYPVRSKIDDDAPESSLVPELPRQGSLF